MNNKIWITIILAGILALCAVMFISKSPKPKQVETTTIEVKDIPVETEAVEVETPELKQQETKQQAAKKVSNKKTIPAKVVTKTPVQKIKTTPIQQKPEVQQEVSITNTEEQPEGVIVPIQYTSKNTYKYVYTPDRF